MVKKILLGSVLLASSLLSYSQNFMVVAGWQLKGSESGFSTMKAFDKECIDLVWSFDETTKSWKAYSPKNSLREKIEESSSIGFLTSIGMDSGFWIKANGNCIIDKENNISSNTSEVIYQTNALWPYTQSFSLDMIANKSFKVWDEVINFDASGEYKDDYVSISLQNGILKFTYKDSCGKTVHTTEAKILAKDEQIGFIVVSRSYDDNEKEYYEYIFPLINKNAQEQPVDMSSKLPYTFYRGSSYDISNKAGVTYEKNGTISYFSEDENYYSHYSSENNFTIEDGALVTKYEDISENFSHHDMGKIQIVFGVGDFDILKTTGEYTSKTALISYEDSNQTWQTLDINSSMQTWQDIFKYTDNRYGSGTYNFDNHTVIYDYMEDDSCQDNITFQISQDGKKLTTCWSNNLDHCETETLDNGYIINSDKWEYYDVVKTKPFL